MFAQANYPTNPINSKDLDASLAKGWFRLGQTIFTCAYLQLEENVYRAFWLRITLNQFEMDTTLKKLEKINSKFKVSIQEACITPEKENLYRTYKSGISFDPSDSLQKLLYHHAETSIYNTLEITIHHNDKLIAVGFFDIGGTSAAGISSFYDPAYKKHSLGKYLIYQKILYCKNLQMDFFYLGYFAPGCKAFDYKLDIARHALEFFDISKDRWSPIVQWNPVHTSLQESRQKLTDLQQLLKVENHLMDYNFFNANLMRELHGFEVFEYTELIYFFEYDPANINLVMVYDIRDGHYHLLNCFSIGMPEEFKDQQSNFSAHILKIQEKIYSTDNAVEMAKVLHAVLLMTKQGMRP